tara:strand:+ start:704 stop:946 length:243 start_codon:yes stop_codon:yes gene_type:complete
MKKIILKVLKEVAYGDTGTCQINLESESAQEMIARKIDLALQPHIAQIIEDIVTPAKHSPMPYVNHNNEFYSRRDDVRKI